MGAFRVGLIGLPNSGKSFSWSNYREGEKVFAICPSSKILHIRTSDGKLIQPMQLKINGFADSLREAAAKKQVSEHEFIKALPAGVAAKAIKREDIVITGNYVHCSDVKYLGAYKKFADLFMPNVNIILSPDFTHYMSYIMASKAFINRKSGGEAFQRFWDLAADMLNNVMLATDELQRIKLDITEFHAEFNEALGIFTVFVPGGKMLSEKFVPESYFDIMLHTHVKPYEEEKDETKRFNFVVIKKEMYDGRSIGLFNAIAKEGMIPNDMNIVISKLSEYLGEQI